MAKLLFGESYKIQSSSRVQFLSSFLVIVNIVMAVVITVVVVMKKMDTV
jgi:hypothetical protein